MGHFRPIALANFQFKIITEILADRLVVIVIHIISVHQRGFVCARHISDCMILASKAKNLLDRKQFGGNMALKVYQRSLWHTWLEFLMFGASEVQYLSDFL